MAIKDFFRSLYTSMTDSSAEQRSALVDPGIPIGSPAAWSLLFDGQPSESGEIVNYQTAMHVSSVAACVRIISQSVASIPVSLMEIVPNGHKEAIEDDRYYLLRVQPNPDMSAYTFFETITAGVAYTGNGYAEIERDMIGRVKYIWPRNPLKTFPVRDTDTGDLYYKTLDGMKDGQYRYVKQSDMLHMKLFSLDGIQGLSPLDQGRRAIGLNIAQEKAGSRVFGNNSKPGNLLIAKGAKNPIQLQEARVSWEMANGAINAGRVGVLAGDWDYRDLGISNQNSQWIESRKFSLQQICALFGVPSHLVGDDSKLSGSNSSEIARQFLQTCLGSYIAQYENELLRKLIATTGRSANKYFIRFDTDQFIRTDPQLQGQQYALYISSGVYSVNDVRRKLGENPIGEQGDIYRMPVNFANADEMVDAETEPNKPIPDNDTDDTAVDDSVSVDSEPAPESPVRQFEMYDTVYRSLFNDAFNRYMTRNNKDSDSVSAVFKPLLNSMSTLAANGSAIEMDSVVDDVLKTIAKRSQKWTSEDTNQEFEKVVRSLHIETAKAIAVNKALAELNK